MQPSSILKKEILLSIDDDSLAVLNKQGLSLDKAGLLPSYDEEYINNLWEKLYALEADGECCYIADFRYTGKNTYLKPRFFNRNYECKEVAVPITGANKYVGWTSKYVGWTYYYGGGKYGEPENIPWVDDAYLLEAETIVREVEIKVCTPIQVNNLWHPYSSNSK